MPLKVIGAGLGRTGTLSLKQALEELGFDPCYHMVEVFKHPEHVAVWDLASKGEKVDWEKLFEGYRSAVDWPSCEYFEQQMRIWPDAKVILSVRDPERWYQSALQTIFTVNNVFSGRLAVFAPKMKPLMAMINRTIWEGKFQGRFEEKDFAIGVFNAHNERVKEVVPVEKLLVFDVKEGWEPLCAFLGVPVPEGKPFPHVNDSREFRSRILKAKIVTQYAPLAVLGAAALLLAGLAIVLWR